MVHNWFQWQVDNTCQKLPLPTKTFKGTVMQIEKTLINDHLRV